MAHETDGGRRSWVAWALVLWMAAPAAGEAVLRTRSWPNTDKGFADFGELIRSRHGRNLLARPGVKIDARNVGDAYMLTDGDAGERCGEGRVFVEGTPSVIADLAWLGPAQRLAKLHELGDEAAGYFRRVLPQVLETYRRVLLLTHVPPFREAAWHEGAISSDHWLPHMSCKAVGDVLAELMGQHPDVEMTVLCGHTHGRGEATIRENLRVVTGGAQYGKPGVGGVLELE